VVLIYWFAGFRSMVRRFPRDPRWRCCRTDPPAGSVRQRDGTRVQPVGAHQP